MTANKKPAETGVRDCIVKGLSNTAVILYMYLYPNNKITWHYMAIAVYYKNI